MTKLSGVKIRMLDALRALLFVGALIGVALVPAVRSTAAPPDHASHIPGEEQIQRMRTLGPGGVTNDYIVIPTGITTYDALLAREIAQLGLPGGDQGRKPGGAEGNAEWTETNTFLWCSFGQRGTVMADVGAGSIISTWSYAGLLPYPPLFAGAPDVLWCPQTPCTVISTGNYLRDPKAAPAWLEMLAENGQVVKNKWCSW